MLGMEGNLLMGREKMEDNVSKEDQSEGMRRKAA